MMNGALGSPRGPLGGLSGPAASRVFDLWSGLGCGLEFAFRKSLGGPSIFSLGSTLSNLGKLPRGSIHHATSSAFPQIVPVSSVASGAGVYNVYNLLRVFPPAPGRAHRSQTGDSFILAIVSYWRQFHTGDSFILAMISDWQQFQMGCSFRLASVSD